MNGATKGKTVCRISLALLIPGALFLPVRAGTGSQSSELIAEQNIRIPVPDAGVVMPVGGRIPLFQENEEYMIGLVNDGERTIPAAFPIERNQRPGWITSSGYLVFGIECASARGWLRIPAGARLPVAEQREDDFLVHVKGVGGNLMLAVPGGIRGFSYRTDFPASVADAAHPPDAGQDGALAPVLAAEPIGEVAPPAPAEPLEEGRAAVEEGVAASRDITPRWYLTAAGVAGLLLFSGIAYRVHCRSRSCRGRQQSPPAAQGVGSTGYPSTEQIRPASKTYDATLDIAPQGNPGSLREKDPGTPGEEDRELFRIGSYSVKAEIGRGSMGVVYRAVQDGLDRPVALKVLREGVHASDDQKESFVREARAAARLRHPNIIAVHEVGEWQGQPFFSMDFIDGKSLDRMIAQQPLSAVQAARLLLQTAIGVSHAHAGGVIHRDLKPANIIVMEDGSPVITDFGLARNMADAGQTVAGGIVGTPAFMSPEQARGNPDEIDARSDVYSLGAILYAALSGRNPVGGKSLVETLGAVIHQDPAPVRRVAPGVDKRLARICERAMRKDRDARYPGAAAMAGELQDYLRWAVRRAGRRQRRKPLGGKAQLD